MSPLDDPDRPEPRDAPADGGGVEYVHDLIDVLVGVGLLFLQPRPAPSAGDDAPFGDIRAVAPH